MMTLGFVLSLDRITNGARAGKIYVKGLQNARHYQRGKNLMIFKGELFPDIGDSELFEAVSQEQIQKLEGEYFIISCDEELGNARIISSKYCWENLFYFYDSERFIVSDDFWEIVNIVEPKESDIDIQSVKEAVVFHQYIFYRTLINNLLYFPPASVGDYVSEKRSFKISQYWDFEYKPNNGLTMEKAVERLDEILDDAMKCIKAKGESSTYGVGLSGGLDSRLVAYYAVKNGLNLTSFIVGETKPQGFLLSRDHDNARNIARLLGIKRHFEVEYDAGGFQDRILKNVRESPMISPGFFMNPRLPKFDILLTGYDGGESFGAMIPSNIQRMSTKDLVDYMVQKLSLMKVQAPTRMLTIVTALTSILHIPYPKPRDEVRQSLEGVISKEEFETARAKICQFVEENKGKDNASILQEFVFFRFDTKNKGGRKQRTFSLYRDPLFREEALTWKLTFLINKSLQSHFFLKSVPELSKIKTQNPDIAIFYRYKSLALLRKLVSFVAYSMRGRNLRYGKWTMNKEYQKCTVQILSKKNKIFERIFNTQKVLALRGSDPDIYNNIVKVKQILDLIEYKGYKKWF